MPAPSKPATIHSGIRGEGGGGDTSNIVSPKFVALLLSDRVCVEIDRAIQIIRPKNLVSFSFKLLHNFGQL